MEHTTQNPTHTNLRITTSTDARAVLFLVDCGLLEPVKRRPDDAEKAQISHGSVFVWLDGAKGETGLERWTDGRQWAGSRSRDDFLIYEEKEGNPRLTKSTYTARRNTIDDDGTLWHLIAYYYSSQVDTLNTVFNIPEFAPCATSMAHGYFVSSRKDKSRKVKEIPPPVKPVSCSITRRLSSSASPYSTPSIIQVHHTRTSRSPAITFSPVPNVLTEPHYAPSFQHSGKLTSVHTHIARPRLSLFVPDANGRRQDHGMPGFRDNEPTPTRHTDPVPTIYAKVLAQDYHRLPGPMDVIRDGDGASDYYCSSPSSPGLSPDSSGSSPIERPDEPALIPSGGHFPWDVERYRASRESLISVRHNSVTLPSITDMDLGVLDLGDPARTLGCLGPARLPEDEKALQKLSGVWPKCF